jgi:hypothetical protein
MGQPETGGADWSWWKAAAFKRWHEPDKSRGLRPFCERLGVQSPGPTRLPLSGPARKLTFAVTPVFLTLGRFNPSSMGWRLAERASPYVVCCSMLSANATIWAMASVLIGGGDSPGIEPWRAMSAVSIGADDFKTVIRN